MKSLWFILLIAVSAQAVVIPVERRTYWTNAGMAKVGGIPNVTTIYTNIPAGCSLTYLNTALANCPSNQVVLLSAGNYNFSNQVNFGRSQGKVLRGAGTGSTYIKMWTNASQASIEVGEQTIDRVAPPVGQVKNWTNGYSQGTNTIYLDSVTGLSVGHLLALDQADDRVWVDSRVQEGCTYCGRTNGLRSQVQYVTITSIAGNTVGIDPGLHMMNWSSSQAPQAFYWTEADTEMCGIESLSITNGLDSGTYAIEFSQAKNCWVKDVKMYETPQAAISSSQAQHLEFRQVFMLSNQSGGGNLSYGIIFYMCSDSLMIDCVCDNVTAGMVFAPQAEGCVVAYNYFTNAVYSPSNWDIASLSSHDGHVCMNLVEGNWANKIYIDSIHGSESHITLARNYFHGHQTNRVNNTMAFEAEQFCLSNNLVGNIFGTTGFHDLYEITNAAVWVSHAPEATIFVLGAANSANATNDSSVTRTGSIYDYRVAASTIRHGNYDTKTAGIIYDSGIADHVIPDSYIYSTKPTNFAALNWPPYDAGSPSNNSPTNIPAGHFYLLGYWPTNAASGGGSASIRGKRPGSRRMVER